MMNPMAARPPRSREQILAIILNGRPTTKEPAQDVQRQQVRPLQVVQLQQQQRPAYQESPHGQQPKRRRLGTRTPHRPAPLPQVQPSVHEEPESPVVSRGQSDVKTSFAINWRRSYAGRKHMRFTGDGTLKVSGSFANLLDSDGRNLGEVTGFKLQEFLDGTMLVVPPFECIYVGD